MPPKALSRFAERGAGWRKPPPTSALVGVFTPDKDGRTRGTRAAVAVRDVIQ